MKNEQNSQDLSLKVDPLSTFGNIFLQPATNDPQQMFLLRDKTSTQNLQWNNVARQVEGYSISYFAALILLDCELGIS